MDEIFNGTVDIQLTFKRTIYYVKKVRRPRKTTFNSSPWIVFVNECTYIYKVNQ